MWHSNGFIITGQPDTIYKGVDNEAWPLEIEEIDNIKINNIHRKLDEDCYRHYQESYVSLLTNLEEIIFYDKICRDNGIRTNILYCETSLLEPKFNIELAQRFLLNSQFIGYDLASKDPDYHSCIKNELLYHPFIFKNVTPQILNSHGLFNKYSDAEGFILERGNILQDATKNIYLEKGDFIIYKLFLVTTI